MEKIAVSVSIFVSFPSSLYSSHTAVSITLPLDVALRVVGNPYRHSAQSQLGKGAVTCRAHRLLQMMDAQSSKERWERLHGQELGCSRRWAEVRLLPCGAVSHSADFDLALPMPLLLHFLGRKWYFPAGMLLWLDMCIADTWLNFFAWFQQGSVGRWPWHLTCCLTREQPVPSKSCCANILRARQPFPWAHSHQGHTFTSLSFATLRHWFCYEVLTILPPVACFYKFKTEE